MIQNYITVLIIILNVGGVLMEERTTKNTAPGYHLNGPIQSTNNTHNTQAFNWYTFSMMLSSRTQNSLNTIWVLGKMGTVYHDDLAKLEIAIFIVNISGNIYHH